MYGKKEMHSPLDHQPISLSDYQTIVQSGNQAIGQSGNRATRASPANQIIRHLCVSSFT